MKNVLIRALMAKKRFVLIASVVTLFIGSVYATPVDPNRALNVAEQFMPSQPTSKRNVKGTPQQLSEIVYTHYMPQSGRPAIYVVNINGGFALISADDVAHPVLGYNYGKPWPTNVDSIAPSVKGFLDDLAAQMEAASEHPQDAATAAEWRQPGRSANRAPRRTTADSSLPDSVGPLLTTTWDQGQYYNAMCPVDQNAPFGYDGHVPTGCVATAMAQIIKYWGDRDTIRTRGIHSYDCNYGNLCVNYDSTSYDFAHMPNQLTAQSTQQEIDAVAKLMYECGVAVNMGYGISESGTNIYDIRSALINNYKYSSRLQYAEKNRMKDRDWVKIISREIANSRPVLYSGNGKMGGHLFVCDGYKDHEFFHFNFGWNGRGDGWFLVNSISPREDMDFNSQQAALLEISVATDADTTSIYAQCSENSPHDCFVISEATDLYNIMANIIYPYTNFNAYDYTITFIPSDSTKQLVLYIMEDVGWDVRIYDGATTTSQLRELLNSGGYYYHVDKSPVVSTQHALTIKFESYIFNTSIHFLVMEDDGCRMPTGLYRMNYDNTRVDLIWDANEVNNLWQVEYGEANFAHGEGTTLLSSTNIATITNLEPLKVYDFYVRAVCDSNQYGIWSVPLTYSLNQQYWPDFVTEKPNGYLEEENGDISISTAEGLAWLSRLSNDKYVTHPETFENRCVKLIANINLGEHNWLPISTFKGVFDGQGYVIDSLISVDFTIMPQSGGLMDEVSDAEIRNVIITNCSIVVKKSRTSGIANSAYNTHVYNCFVSGDFLSDGSSAIINSAINTTIINCGAICSYINKESSYSAGICSFIEQGKILNCYSSVRINSLTPQLVSGICSSSYKSEVSNCYASYYLSSDYQINKWVYESYLSNLSYFIYDNNEWQTLDSIEFENATTNNLLEVLNNGVEMYNISHLKLWELDTSGVYDGLPVLSNIAYTPICPNTNSFTLRNIFKDGRLGIEISINNEDSVPFYELQYGVLFYEGSHDIDSIRFDTIYSSIDTLYGFENGNKYIFKIRPYCDEIHHGAWSDEKSIIFDIPYWTDVVTSQPDSYIENANGEIFISSAEGLAWLCSVVNGFNNQLGTDLSGKTVILQNDINMQGYKWQPLSSCQSCLFDGGGHTIEGLYIKEQTDYVGFFANLNNSTIKNIQFRNAMIKGHYYAGSVCGYGAKNHFLNTYVETATVEAYHHAGGLAGFLEFSLIDNCGCTGIISADNSFAGGVSGGLFNNSTIRNTYSSCAVSTYSYAGLFIGESYDARIENCYVRGDLDVFIFGGGILGTSRDILLKNIYTTFSSDALGYLVNNESPLGVTTGYNLAIQVENFYFPSGSSIPQIGTNDTLAILGLGVYSFIDTASYNTESNIQAFSQPVTIAETPYTDLLSALNAWVDANNNEGKYLHWIADTANINGGFPILAEPTKYVVTFQDWDGTVLQRDTLYEGIMPAYKGETPIKPATAEYTYTFAGWMPEVVPVTEDATYMATYMAVPNVITDIENPYQRDIPQKVLIDNTIYILRDGKTYTLQGQEVK